MKKNFDLAGRNELMTGHDEIKASYRKLGNSADFHDGVNMRPADSDGGARQTQGVLADEIGTTR